MNVLTFISIGFQSLITLPLISAPSPVTARAPSRTLFGQHIFSPQRSTFPVKLRIGLVSPDLYIPTPLYQAQPSAPTLYLIRHGQAEHNVNPSHLARRDTILTETGRLQAAKPRAVLPDSSRRRIGAVVASPLRRALLTALIGFEDLITLSKVKAREQVTDSAAGIYSTTIDHFQSRMEPFRLVALPEAQETSDLPCDTGLPIADLAVEFNATESRWRGCVDFGLISAEEWGSKAGKWACDRETLEQRARETRRWLRQKMRQLSLTGHRATNKEGEKQDTRGDCVLVTHRGFLHLLTEDWEGFDVKAGQLGRLAFTSLHAFVNSGGLLADNLP